MSGGEDHIAHVWDAFAGTCRVTYHGHTDDIDSLAWSPDGKRIASGSTDRTVRIWDAAAGTLHLTYRGHEAIASEPLVLDALSWSPSGFYLASGSEDGTAQVWDSATGKQLQLFQGNGLVYTLAWLQNGAFLFCGSHENVRISDVATGEALLSYKPSRGRIFYNAVSTPDGSYIASVEENGAIRIWHAGTGEAVYTYRAHSRDASAVIAWSPDGRRIVSASNQEVYVWQALFK